MNILPLISAFILIFAIGSYTFVHNLSASIQECRHFCASTQLSQKLSRRCQTSNYRKIKGKNLHPKSKGSGKKKDIEYTSPRDRPYPTIDSKLNIAALLKEENPKLEQVASELIRSLYQFTSIYEPELEETIISLFKASKSISSIEELLSKVAEDQRPLFYKLIKGTQNYTLFTSKGYPALGDYLKIGYDKERAIHFCHASRPLLLTLFGPQIPPQIINEEKHKWEPDHVHSPMNKEELEPFLLSCNRNLSDYEELMDFKSSRIPLEDDIFKDEATGIRIKMKR